MTTIPPFGAGDLPSSSDEVQQLIILNGESNNAISTASALGRAGERSDEPVVLFLGNELRRDGAVDMLTNEKPR